MNKAILVVSFGSSYEDTIRKTIEQIERDMKEAFPEWKVYRAFTSKRIISSLNKKKFSIEDVEKALMRMKEEGIKKVIVQPTFIIMGIEYGKMCGVVERFKGEFEEIEIARPLLASVEDYFKTIDAFAKEIGETAEDEAVVAMGHGAEHFMSVSYAALDYMMKDRGYENIYIATIGSYPGIDTIINKLKKGPYKKVRVIPFMIVAGYHVQKSLIEEEEESWERKLEEAGFKVSMQLTGLGENQGIRAIYIEHTRELMK